MHDITMYTIHGKTCNLVYVYEVKAQKGSGRKIGVEWILELQRRAKGRLKRLAGRGAIKVI